MPFKRYFVAISAVAVLALSSIAGGAGAQTTQTGLVNISATNTTVQVPIAVAANLCDVNLAVLAVQRKQGGSTTCTAMSTATVPVTVGTPPAGATTQTGLINVSLTNTTIQVPIAAAINICGVNAAILAVQELLGTGSGSCTATASSG